MSDSENISQALIDIATTAAEKWNEAAQDVLGATQQREANIAEHLQTICSALGAIVGEVHMYAKEAAGDNALGTGAIDQGRKQLAEKLEGTTNQKALNGLDELQQASEKMQQITGDIQTTEQIVTTQIDQAAQPLLILLERVALERLKYPFLGQHDLEAIASLPEGGETDIQPFHDVGTILDQALTDITGYSGDF